MEILLLLLLIGLLTFGYRWYQEKREQKLAERLASVRDPHEASVLLASVQAQQRREAEFFSDLRDHR